MRGKPYTSREKEIISNVYSYFKANNPFENKAYLIRKTAEATKSSFSSVRRISEESDDGKGHKSPSRKKPNRKDVFNKLDDFDQEAVRRAIHWFYNRNESPTLAKLLKKLKEDFNFPYGRTWLGKLIKKLGFRFKKKARGSILYETTDLIEWRENFLRRIKEIREKEPEREIVHTDETWVNVHHKVEKEWVDEEALKNPSKSLKDYGTVGCTKEKIGKGKRLIVIDCITESGPVPGALWIFSETKSKKEGKTTVQHVETAVEIHRAVEQRKEEGKEEETEINRPGSYKTRKRKLKSTADKSSKQPKQFRESANFIDENDEKKKGMKLVF